MTGAGVATSLRRLLSLGLAAAVLGAPGRAAAQEDPDDAPPEEPPMAVAPDQFRLGLTGGALWWPAEPDRARVGDDGLVGLEVERRAGRFLAFRASGAYGRTTAASGEVSTGLNQYLVDVLASLRLDVGPARRAGVVPFGTIGLGSVVHDPEDGELVTKSQSAAVVGAGLDLDLSRTFELRAEWRRYLVDSEDLFDAVERTGRGRPAHRLQAGIFLKL